MTDTTPAETKSPFRTDPDLRTSLRLPARTLLRSESTSHTLQVQVRMAAVTAASQLFQGCFPMSREGDMEEFLACAHDLEEWINGS